MEICSLCNTRRAKQQHHLIPKAIANKKHFTSDTIPVCNLCHNFIHLVFRIRRLANELNNVEKIRASIEFRKFLRNPGMYTEMVRANHLRKNERKSNRKRKRRSKENSAEKDERIRIKHFRKYKYGVERILVKDNLVKKYEKNGWIIRNLDPDEILKVQD